MARNSSRAFRKRALMVVARDGQICGICGHGWALTVDHIISAANWPKDELGNPLPGLDDPDNLRAAHGTRGIAPPNPCMECDPIKGRLCNQSRGSGKPDLRRRPAEPHSRRW